jgi:hypothetical protein
MMPARSLVGNKKKKDICGGFAVCKSETVENNVSDGKILPSVHADAINVHKPHNRRNKCGSSKRNCQHHSGPEEGTRAGKRANLQRIYYQYFLHRTANTDTCKMFD